MKISILRTRINYAIAHVGLLSHSRSIPSLMTGWVNMKLEKLGSSTNLT